MKTAYQNAIDQLSTEGYQIDLGKIFNGAWNTYRSHVLNFVLYNFVMFLLIMLSAFTLIGLFMAPHFIVGNFYVADKIRRGESYTFGDFFEGFRHFRSILRVTFFEFLLGFLFYVPFLIAYGFFIYQMAENSYEMQSNPLKILMYEIPMIICLFPALIGTYWLRTRYFFSLFLVLFGQMSGSEAMKASVAMSKKNFWMILVCIFISGAVGGLGVIACYVGILFTMPFTYIFMYEMFNQIVISKVERLEGTAADISQHLVK